MRISALPNNRLKPISREALARCVELTDQSLADKVRLDNSFDVAIISSCVIGQMEAELFKYNGDIPLFDLYCGHAIKKVMSKLPYDVGYDYPSSVRI
tara:strand:+ start:129 stop:419 length:291 start_codon:yes stop_codon:yes gene_type:complete